MQHDTIAAISTAIGHAAISVIRLTGPDAAAVAGRVLEAATPVAEWLPRRAMLASARDANQLEIDSGLALLFRAPASYTGEDLVEFQGHGGPLVTQKVLEAFLAAGARPANPGEFSQRAFLNGKMDLTQAEAVMDLINAQSALAARAASEQLGGAIRRESDAIRQPLVEVLAHVEAWIDFPEEDISPDTGDALLARLESLIQATERLLATAESGRILRHGARTVITGAPNVGKSSLLNTLLGFERAIVSPAAGTTRDTIEEVIQVGGFPLRLIDTAGLRDHAADQVEQVGMERTRLELEKADLILEVVDGSKAPPADSPATSSQPDARRLLLVNKADLPLHESWRARLDAEPERALAFSCLTRDGLDALQGAIQRVLARGGALGSDHPVAINARHKHCFQTLHARLREARDALSAGEAPEFVAVYLREALQALGEVTGHTDIEQILDVIFSSFCIGK
jgi:tRNA modification GTPase